MNTTKLTNNNHTTTYTPDLYGSGKLFVCDCGLSTDDGAEHFWHSR